MYIAREINLNAGRYIMRHRQLATLQLVVGALMTLTGSVRANDVFCFDTKDPGSFFESHDNSISSITSLDNGQASSNWPFAGKVVTVDLNDVKKHLVAACGSELTWPSPDYDDCPEWFVYSDLYCGVPGLIESGAIEHTFREIDETTCVPNALARYDCSGVKVVDATPDWAFIIPVASLAAFLLCSVLSCCLSSGDLEQLESRPASLLQDAGVADGISSTAESRFGLSSSSPLNSASQSRYQASGFDTKSACDDEMEQGRRNQFQA